LPVALENNDSFDCGGYVVYRHAISIEVITLVYIALPNVGFNQKPHSLIPQKESAELRVK